MYPLTRVAAVVSMTVVASAAGGCARGGVTPQDAVRAYAHAIESENADRAWALASDDYRRSHSRERFDAELADRAEAGPEYADRLRDAARGPATVSAALPFSEFETLELRYVDGTWRITAGVGDLFSQATPRQALQTFLRAVRSRDTETLLRLVPAEFRAQISPGDLDLWLDASEAELSEMLELLEASADGPIVERDGNAVLRYGAREIVFALEGALWVIADFD